MRKIVSFMLILSMVLVSALASSETLRYGMCGEGVVQLQQSLIEKGFLKGEADGVFGYKTEKAIRAFQKSNNLKIDGIAGECTQAVLYNRKSETGSTGYFSGDYRKIISESDIDRIKLLQKALIKLNYLKGSADGIYGSMTENAVLSFQSEHRLREDGIAGRKTLAAIESALQSGFKHQSVLDKAEPLSSEEGKLDAPAKSSIKLLHWYNDIKPGLKSNAKLLIYDPASGLSWTLRVYSRGRHCDAEPLSLKDTQIMMKAFGNKHTWEPKGVYVRLSDGRWTIGATHNVPHLNNHLLENGFDGVLCVHFYRDMEECSRLDPKYGVQNQKVLRSLWEKLSGEVLE